MASERDELQTGLDSDEDERAPHEVSWDGSKLSLTHGTSATFLYAPFVLIGEGERIGRGRLRFEVLTNDGQRALIDVGEADGRSLDALRRASTSRARTAPALSLAPSPHLGRAGRLAAIVELLAWIYFGAGLLAAIFVAERHGPHSPYVWQGIGVALTTTLLSLAAVMVAAYVRGRTE